MTTILNAKITFPDAHDKEAKKDQQPDLMKRMPLQSVL